MLSGAMFSMPKPGGKLPRTPLYSVTKGDELSREPAVGDELSGDELSVGELMYCRKV